MSEQFDPYRMWLGIPPQHQPPHHYRLLGIELFESDADVIAHAADQRMVHLKTFASGKHSAFSQQLLNEVAAARVCLLNSAERTKYDAALREKLPQQQTSVPAKRSAPAAAPAQRQEEVAEAFDPLAESPASSVVPRSKGSTSETRKQKSQSIGAWIAVGTTGVAVLLVAAIVFANLSKDAPTKVANANGTDNGQAPSDPVPKKDPSKTPVDPPDSRNRPDSLKSGKSPIVKAGQTVDPPPKEVQPPEDPPKENTSTDASAQDPPKEEPSADPPQENPPKEEPPRNDRPPDVEPKGEAPLGPDGKPIKKVRPKVLPSQPIEPEKAPEPEVRESVPADDAIKTAEKEIRELFKDSMKEATKPEQKLALAATFKRTALESKDSPASQYVLLRMAAIAFAEANDLDGAFGIIDQAGRRFDVNASEMKAAVLAKADAVTLKAGPQAAQPILITARQLAEESIGAGEIEAASQCLKIATGAATRMKDVATRKQIQDAQKDIDRLKTQSVAVKKAIERLKTDPENRTANTDAGRWNCFVRADWKTGLPQLAKGEDETLCELAKADLAAPEETDKQLAMGERWLAQATDKKGLELARINDHASSWYRKALPKLSGLDRAKVEKQLEKIGIRISAYALKFDGAKTYVMVRGFVYGGTQPITVEVIVKFDGNAPGNYQTIFGTGSYPGFYLSRSSSYYNFHFSVYDSSTVSNRYVTPIPHVWNHVAIEYDGDRMCMFVNGREVSQSTTSGAYQASPNFLVLGAQPTRATRTTLPVPSQFFAGEIRGLRVSNTMRYSKDFTPPAELSGDASTKLLFLFNEGKGNVLKDSSGSKLNGEIMGAEWVKVDDLTIGGGNSAEETPTAPMRGSATKKKGDSAPVNPGG